MSERLHLSFEFFPPRTESACATLLQTATELAALSPDFFSITFGASGSVQHGTQETVNRLSQHTTVECVPHISCVHSTKQAIKTLLTDYQQHGVTKLVVLRGDKPSGVGNDVGELRYASELVKFVRDTTGDHFTIYVAAYPEYHPESTSVTTDLTYLKHKVDQGADAIITQYFYNSDAYFYLRDNCMKTDITVPILPGIMPITNYKQLARFSDSCGAELPQWLRKRLADFGDDLESLRAFGLEVVTKLCECLRQQGVPGFHFYTLNQATACMQLCRLLQLTR